MIRFAVSGLSVSGSWFWLPTANCKLPTGKMSRKITKCDTFNIPAGPHGRGEEVDQRQVGLLVEPLLELGGGDQVVASALDLRASSTAAARDPPPPEPVKTW